MYNLEDSGRLPKWMHAGFESSCYTSTKPCPLLVSYLIILSIKKDAYINGIRKQHYYNSRIVVKSSLSLSDMQVQNSTLHHHERCPMAIMAMS